MRDSSRLPGLISTLWEQQYRGTCLGMGSPVFSHPEGERGNSHRRRDERAKAICQDCPVLDERRDHALSIREPYGVWEGMSEEEQRAYYKRQTHHPADEPA